MLVNVTVPKWCVCVCVILGYLKIRFSWSSTSFPGNSGRPALASSKQDTFIIIIIIFLYSIESDERCCVSNLRICTQLTTCRWRWSTAWPRTARPAACTTASPPETRRRQTHREFTLPRRRWCRETQPQIRRTRRYFTLQ